jgi:hypothetical protein
VILWEARKTVDFRIENPCVPGSIPGRATIKYLGPSIFSVGAFLLGQNKLKFNVKYNHIETTPRLGFLALFLFALQLTYSVIIPFD